MVAKRFSGQHLLVLLTISFAGAFGQEDSSRATTIYKNHASSVFVVVVTSESGQPLVQGTGFVVEGGKVVTNEHVVRNGNTFIDIGAARIPATVESTDLFNDLAVLMPQAQLTAKPLALGSALPEPGTFIVAIGNPAGLERSVSTGVVSGTRVFKERQLLQITAPISPGSSGGPIIDERGVVVGVAVGVLDSGQNLNFAVPAPIVRDLMAGPRIRGGNYDSLMKRISELFHVRGKLKFSEDTDSAWQKTDRQIDAVLKDAVEAAGSDWNKLIEVAKKAEGQNWDIAMVAAEKSLLVQQSAPGHLVLAKVLQRKAAASAKDEKEELLVRAESAMRAALKSIRFPTVDLYYHLADILEDRGSLVESEVNFRRAQELSPSDSEVKWNSIRGLIRITSVLEKHSEAKSWFKLLSLSGNANSLDWEFNGERLDDLGQYLEAGHSYKRAAELGGAWTNWCEAAGSFHALDGTEDLVLACARECIRLGTLEKKSEKRVAYASRLIASALNARGVYQEALDHARESIALVPDDPWAFHAMAESLRGLRRFREAINASQQAIRLSDGKYVTMHFQLASSHFDLENWEFAKQSFQKSAELDKKDDASAYNVALCFTRLGYFHDAANWYEEVLRRNPARRDRDQILAKIADLRR